MADQPTSMACTSAASSWTGASCDRSQRWTRRRSHPGIRRPRNTRQRPRTPTRCCSRVAAPTSKSATHMQTGASKLIASTLSGRHRGRSELLSSCFGRRGMPCRLTYLTMMCRHV